MNKKKNVYDIRKELGLIKILPNKGTEKHKNGYNIAAFIYLYYEDDIHIYEKYINSIPKEIDVYIIVTNIRVYKELKLVRETFVLEKKNRGRDITALLVSAKEVVNNYDLFCFLHDKQAKNDYTVEDVQLWMDNMWGNLLGSEDYIRNVVNLFDNKEIGLLLPPEPIRPHRSVWGRAGWGPNYNNCIKLRDKMRLNAPIDEDIPPIAFGTMFWARTKSLKKLFDIGWTYEDFKEEPLPDDGEINHTIERILPYVAQDAGFLTLTVMSDRYAEKMYLYFQEMMGKSLEILSEYVQIKSLNEIENFDSKRSELREFINNYEKIYLYGAGLRGEGCFKYLKCVFDFIPDGFIETKKTQSEYCGLPIYEIDEVHLSENDGIIISVGHEFRSEIEQILRSMGVTNYISYVG